MTPLSSFKTVEEELEYFKRHTKNLEDDLSETKYALEEFQLSSKELEEELEKEIDSTERRYNEIKIRNEAMRQEAEEWKVKNMFSYPYDGVVCVCACVTFRCSVVLCGVFRGISAFQSGRNCWRWVSNTTDMHSSCCPSFHEPTVE